MGSYNVGFIIDIALPALMLIYPVSIVLIILNLIYDKWASPIVFKGVVTVTLIFSLIDVLPFFMASEDLEPILKSIPLARYNMGWIIPSLATFFSLNLNQVIAGNISNSM